MLHIQHMVSNKNNTHTASDISTVCVAYNLRKVSRQLSKFYQEIISASGLQGTQFPLLYAIKRNQPITITELAQVLDLDKTTLSRNLKLLEKNDYIFIGSQRSDSRLKNVALTAQGLQALENALPLWQEAQDRIVEEFGEERWQQTLQALHELATIAK